MKAKQVISFLICAVFLIGLLPATALAVENSPFTDVETTDWFYDGVQYTYEHGMMNGTGNGMFSPNMATTRGMIVTILHRLEGTPSAHGMSFSDVASGKWYSEAVSWASSKDIVNGYGNGRFGPEDTITREQMATILYRYANYKGYDVSASTSLSRYTDSWQISPYAVESMTWANAAKLVTGTTSTALSPKGSATRAQVSVIWMRFCKQFLENTTNPYEDLVTDAYSQEITYSDGTASYHIPRINLNSGEVEKINTELYDTLYPIIQNSVSETDDYGYPDTSGGITYHWAVNGDVLSLVVSNLSHPTRTPGTEYFVYNVSVSAMKAVSKETVFKQAGFSQEEYYKRAEQALGSRFWRGLDRTSEAFRDSSFVTEFNTGLSRTISRENIEEAYPYINESGQLCIIAKTYLEVAAEIFWHDLNLVDFELIPDYAEPAEQITREINIV